VGIKTVCINGHWSVRVHWHCWRRTRQVTPNTEERALEVAEKLRIAINLYGVDALLVLDAPKPETPKQTPTIKEYASQWTEQLEIEPIKRSTRESYKYLLRVHVLPHFGKLQPEEITYAIIKDWVRRKLKTHSKNTVRLMLAALRSMLNEAIKDGHISVNPVHDLGRVMRGGKRAREKMDPFTLDELHAIEDKCRVRFPEYYGFLLLMSRTGMRIGEATGMQWRDLDEHTGQILVRRNIPHHRDVETPKTPASDRRVDLSPDLLAELVRLRGARKAELLRAGRRWNAEEWIFRTEAETPLHYNNFVTRVWNKCQELARARIRGVHNLRHTWASQMLAIGADPAYVAAQLGHSSPAITLRIYAHFVPGTRRVGPEALDKNANNAQTKKLADAEEK
jgi:integrase